MDFISNLTKTASKPDSDESGHQDKGAGGLFSDAKVVAAAAQAQFGNQPEKCDKAKAAGSAANILETASDYAKLDETKGVGKYVDQAEDYLRSYGKPPAAAAATPGENKPSAEADPAPPKESGEEKHTDEKKGSSEGGYGDVMKMAGGFLGK